MNSAWVAVIRNEGYELGLADRGVPGYSPMRDPIRFDTYEQASEAARTQNRSMGLTDAEALEIVVSSMVAQRREA